MFKCKITHKNTYAEMDQPNPLRWRLMFKEKDGSLSSQSGLIACKDFFNDVVAWKHTKTPFVMYKFDNQVKFNDGGMYILLSNIANKKQFTDNIEKALNPQLKKDLGVEIEITQQGPKEVVVLIPQEVWQSTYHVSVVSMMIRLCNYAVDYLCWDDFFKEDAPINTIEGAFNTAAKEFVQEHRFSLPEKFKGYWYFARNGWNSQSDKEIIPSIIHNNGATDWTYAMSAA